MATLATDERGAFENNDDFFSADHISQESVHPAEEGIHLMFIQSLLQTCSDRGMIIRAAA